MAYSTSTPPALISQRIGNSGAIWWYTSTDAPADVDLSGYITNAKDLGMKVNDLVIVIDTDAAATARMSLHNVAAINADGSADLGNGTVIGGSNSD